MQGLAAALSVADSLAADRVRMLMCSQGGWSLPFVLCTQIGNPTRWLLLLLMTQLLEFNRVSDSEVRRSSAIMCQPALQPQPGRLPVLTAHDSSSMVIMRAFPYLALRTQRWVSGLGGAWMPIAADLTQADEPS